MLIIFSRDPILTPRVNRGTWKHFFLPSHPPAPRASESLVLYMCAAGMQDTAGESIAFIFNVDKIAVGLSLMDVQKAILRNNRVGKIVFLFRSLLRARVFAATPVSSVFPSRASLANEACIMRRIINPQSSYIYYSSTVPR